MSLAQKGTVIYDGVVIAEGTDFTLNKGGCAGTVSYRHKIQGTEDSTYVTGLPINVGSYTREAVVAEDGTNCYKAGTTNGNITIAKRALTITAQNKLNIIKGSAMPTFTYTSAGLVNDDTVTTAPTMSCSVTDTNTLGEYVITISDAVVSNPDSYHITYVNGKMTVVNDSGDSGNGGCGDSGSGDSGNGGSGDAGSNNDNNNNNNNNTNTNQNNS